MARPIWTGVISFGLVSIPIGLYSATQAHEVSFHQFEKGTGDRIRYQRVNERTGEEVDYADIVKGTDVGRGKYVMLDQDELDAVAPGRSKSLDIHTFVDLDEIDPIFYQKTYYLAPGSDETAKTYALLRDAMTDAHRAAIATLVMRGKEYLAAVRPDGDMLVLETMFFADEVRNPHQELDRLPGSIKVRPAELKMASQLIESMAGPWNPDDYRDTYTDRVNDLIKAKKRGATVAVADEAPPATNVVNLMDALRNSVDAAKKRRTGAKKTTAKKTTAKKATAKSSAGTGGKRPAAKTTKSLRATKAEKAPKPAKKATKKPAKRAA